MSTPRVRFPWSACLVVTAIALLSVAATGRQAPAKQSAKKPAGPPATTPSVTPALAKGTEILWDNYGVPHIFAKTNAGAFYALGWAQMEAHGDLILRLYGESRGRAAEYWGGTQNLDSDRWVRTMGIPARAKVWVAQQAPEFRGFLDAFVAGMKASAVANQEKIAAEMLVVFPVTAEDVMAHSQRVIQFAFVTSRELTLAQAARWAQGQAPARSSLDFPEPILAGSNAWAIAPSHSASGKAMLLANPHLPWTGFFTWFEVHLTSPALNISGATLVGFPTVSIGFNDFLGWTHTVNTIDAADLYELTLDDGGYNWDGAVKPLESSTEIIKVKSSDGQFTEEKLVVTRSIHGPLIVQREGKALALRVAGLDTPNLGQQYWEMMRAKNLKEFESALAKLQMPMFTTMYADRDGHILHLFGGRVPVRPAGNWNWTSVVPGDTSATLWTTTHPYADLPRVLDPPSGWLQNANDPPWTTTFPPALDPAKFPSYMSPRGMALRPQRSARMLAEDDKLTFDELVSYKHSTRMELADRLLDDLQAAVTAGSSEKAKQAWTVLAAWDRSADEGSKGAVLFAGWWRALVQRSAGRSPFAVAWDEKNPRLTPDGLADPAAVVSALETAAGQVEQLFGKMDVPWGEINRFRRAGLDFPANGAGGNFGVFRVITFTRATDGKGVGADGDSYVAAIEFSTPLRAQSLIGYGNWSQSGFKHVSDQLEFLAKKQLRPVWRSKTEIEAHLESRKVF